MRHLANHQLEKKPLEKQMGGTASTKGKIPTAQILEWSLKPSGRSPQSAPPPALYTKQTLSLQRKFSWLLFLSF